MKALLWVGLGLLILGIASLLVPIPRSEREGIKVGGVSIGLETRHEEKVPPLVSAAMILGGVGLILTSSLKNRRA
jgi:hypothetical protein